MKKLLASLMALSMVFAVTGCSESSDSSSESKAEAKTTTTTTAAPVTRLRELIRIMFTQAICILSRSTQRSGQCRSPLVLT